MHERCHEAFVAQRGKPRCAVCNEVITGRFYRQGAGAEAGGASTGTYTCESCFLKSAPRCYQCGEPLIPGPEAPTVRVALPGVAEKVRLHKACLPALQAKMGADAAARSAEQAAAAAAAGAEAGVEGGSRNRAADALARVEDAAARRKAAFGLT